MQRRTQHSGRYLNFLLHLKKEWRHACIVLLLGAVLSASNTSAQDEDAAKAAKLKAAYLYNFIKFVEWPKEKAPSSGHAASICLLGSDPSDLQRMLSAKKDLAIIPAVTPQNIDMRQCNILYIERGYVGEALLAAAREQHVLTVSNETDFADNGGVIEMKTVERNVGLFSSNKINLRVNTKTATDSSLRINAQLLEIAAEVIK